MESSLGATLSWERRDAQRRSRLAWFWPLPVTINDSSDTLRELITWAIENCLLFRDALSGYLSSLPAEFEFELNGEIDESDAEAPENEEDGVRPDQNAQ